MLRQVRNAALVLLGVAYGLAGSMLITTLTPGGITLGLLLFGLGTVLYFLWRLTGVLLQIRELLMLSITYDYDKSVLPIPVQDDDKESLLSADMDAHLGGDELHADR